MEGCALAWAEAVTHVSDDHVPDAAYDDARAQFNEKELADLTLAIAAINAWNRLSIAARLAPGTYQPAPAEPGAVGAPGVTGLASGDARCIRNRPFRTDAELRDAPRNATTTTLRGDVAGTPN